LVSLTQVVAGIIAEYPSAPRSLRGESLRQLGHHHQRRSEPLSEEDAQAGKQRRFLYPVVPPLGPPSVPEGTFIARSREIRIFEGYAPVTLATAVKARRGNCCKQHPELPAISVAVDFANMALNVTVTASHACGIKHLTAYIAEENVALMQPGNVPVKSYVPKLVGGHFIDDSADNNAAGEVSKTFSLPTGELVGEQFFIAGTATDACGNTNGDHKGPWTFV
jgi:hypothetical protein